MEKEETFILETVKIMRPTNRNHVFNTEDYLIIQTIDNDGGKLVILRSKEK